MVSSASILVALGGFCHRGGRDPVDRCNVAADPAKGGSHQKVRASQKLLCQIVCVHVVSLLGEKFWVAVVASLYPTVAGEGI